MRFSTTILSHGKTATGIRVPDDVVASFGTSKRPAVRVTIKGHTYRSTVAVMGGQYMLGISAADRRSAAVAAGDEVQVDMELDTEPREVTVPADFGAALGRDPDALRFFDELSYSQRRRYVMSIDDAKTAETRQRRIDGAVTKLRDGRT